VFDNTNESVVHLTSSHAQVLATAANALQFWQHHSMNRFHPIGVSGAYVVAGPITTSGADVVAISGAYVGAGPFTI